MLKSASEGGNGMINNENLKKKILDEIEKAGLPLEIKTSNILELDDWQVINQEGYLDSDKQIWRTNDIRANKANPIVDRKNSRYNYFNLSLIIECKKVINLGYFLLKICKVIPTYY